MNFGFFGLIDLIVVLLGLLAIGLGFYKGFMKKMIGFFGFLIMIAVSIALASNFAEFMINHDMIYPSIYSSIYDKMQSAVASAGEGATTADVIASALGIPAFIASIIAGKLPENTGELSTLVAQKVSTYAMHGIAFLILVVSLNLLLVILKIVAHCLRKNKFIKTVDGILGAALYFLIYVLVISLLFFFLRLMVEHNVFSGNALEFIQTDLQLETDAGRLSKFLYYGNIFASIKELFS